MGGTVTHTTTLGGSDNPAYGVSRDEWNGTGAHSLALDIVNADINASAAIAESKLALNFATHANNNDPTAGEKAALAGTGGTPGGSNKYITEEDARIAYWPSADEKGGLAGTSGTPSDTNRFVTDQDARLVSSIKVPVTIPYFLPTSGGPITWSNVPTSETEFLGVTYRRFAIDLNQAVSIGIQCVVTSLAGTSVILRVQYTTDLTGATGWTTITNAQVALTATGMRIGGFATIPAGAKPGGTTEVLLRVAGISSNGTDDVVLGSIYLKVK